jgi:protease II
MKKSLLFLIGVLLALSVSCTQQEPAKPGEAAEAPAKPYTIEQFLKTVSIGGGSFNYEETKLLVSTNETGIFNVYTIDVATGERTPITTSTGESTFAIGYFPLEDRILFTHDKGGNEINHLFLLNPDGSIRELTEGEKTKEEFGGFAYDDKSFFTINNGRDARFFDIYEVNIETLEKNLFFRNDYGFFPGDMSNDKRWLAFYKPNTTNDGNIYLKDLQSGEEPFLITEHEGEINFQPSTFSPDSKYLYYLTDEGSEFSYIKRYEPATGQHEEFLKADWDINFIYFSRAGKYRVIGINEDGITKIRITEMATGRDLELPELPIGEITGIGFSRSEKLMRFYLVSDKAPSNLFVYNIEAGTVKQLTDNLNPEIDPNDLVESTLIRYEARDGMEIPAYLYQPKGASAENKVPALLWIHGGPGGQSRPLYNAERQFCVNHGYALFVVNNRGSSGYGKTFYAADDQKHGREPLWDCVDAKNYLIENVDWIDPDKIGIIGGSYGGYMVLAALAFEPEEFAVGVDIFGVANWVRTLQSIPAWWEARRTALYAELGDPNTQLEMLTAISPAFHGDKITKPLIILQGANDPRVLKAESDDMVAAIEAKNGIVEYIVFDDEGHGFSKTPNRIKGWEAILKFLDKYLKGEE